MATPGTTVKGSATTSEQKQFISMVQPSFSKYAKQYGFKIVSFSIAQACFEGGWGFSYASVNYKNVLGIGPGMVFDSWDSCIKKYYTGTVLGTSKAAKSANSLDEFYKAFVASGYLGHGGSTSSYYNNIKAIVKAHNLEQYDNGGGSFDAAEAFIQEALSHLGESYYDWTRGMLGKSGYEPWCADFIWAVAKKLNFTGKAISGSASAHLLISDTASKCGGVIHSGSSSYTPQKGDLVNFVWYGGTWADHIGIVTSTSGGTVYTVEGNSGDRVAKRSYSRSSSCLLRFCTPDWSKVGGTGSSSGGYILGDLYETENTREDAIVREVAYVSSSYKETTSISRVKLSVVNYTDLFSAFWDAGKGLLGPTVGSDLSGLEPKVREVVQFFNEKGLNNAAACGICGNIYYESNFNTAAVGDYGTSFGICQWHLGRGDKMKKMAGPNWSSNLTGQLDYLWYELNKSYKSVLNHLKSVPNTEAGAKSAADKFVRDFEVPANVDQQSIKRQSKAAEYFKQITSTVSTSGDSFNSVNMNNVSAKRQTIVNAARSQLGVPYVWGGETPNKGLDCSGLTMYCYKKAGISIGHYTESQYSAAPHKNSISKAVIGDILYKYGHVGIFIGDNKYIHAPQPGDVVKIATGVNYFSKALHWDI